MTLSITEKIKVILGRDPEIESTTYKGQPGFIPLYFNYTFKNNVSDVFNADKEKCLESFYKFLLNNQGDTSGIDTNSERQPSEQD